MTRIRNKQELIHEKNPGLYTLQGDDSNCLTRISYFLLTLAIGTNTYLIGKRAPYILLDTGEGRPEYLKYLREALSTDITRTEPEAPYISDVIITHKHRDHHGGLPSVLTLLAELEESRNKDATSRFIGPKLYKFPLPQDEALDAHYQAIIDSLSDKKFTRPPEDVKIPNETPFHPLTDGQTIRAEGVDMQVLHTPGHTADSICVYLPEDNALLTADSILGHGTAVFENLSLYMKSLQTLASFEYPPPGLQKIYPGHGPVIEEGAKDVIDQYIAHRLEREQQIIQVLQSRPDSWWTVDEILSAIYPVEVRDMARRGVLLHLDKLEVDGKVTRRQDETVQWKINPTNRL